MRTHCCTMAYVTLLVGLALGASPARAKAEKGQAQLPEAIASAFQASFPSGVIAKVDVEKEDGVTIYDIEFKEGDTERECDMTADGAILSTATAVDPKSVPEAVMKAFLQAADGGLISRVERSEIHAATKDGKVTKLAGVKIEYEAGLKKGDRVGEVTVADDGAVVEAAKWFKHGEDTND